MIVRQEKHCRKEAQETQRRKRGGSPIGNVRAAEEKPPGFAKKRRRGTQEAQKAQEKR